MKEIAQEKVLNFGGDRSVRGKGFWSKELEEVQDFEGKDRIRYIILERIEESMGLEEIELEKTWDCEGNRTGESRRLEEPGMVEKVALKQKTAASHS